MRKPKRDKDDKWPDKALKEDCVFLGLCPRDFAIDHSIYYVITYEGKLYIVSYTEINRRFRAMNNLNIKLKELRRKSYYTLSQSDQNNFVSMLPSKSALETFLSQFPSYRENIKILMSESELSWIDNNLDHTWINPSIDTTAERKGRSRPLATAAKGKGGSSVDGEVSSLMNAVANSKIPKELMDQITGTLVRRRKEPQSFESSD